MKCPECGSEEVYAEEYIRHPMVMRQKHMLLWDDEEDDFRLPAAMVERVRYICMDCGWSSLSAMEN